MKVTKPRTQRRRMYQAPAHIRHRFFSAPLSPDLKKKHYTNAIPVKTGDTIRIMRGDRKGFEGKIIRVSRKKHRIYVEGVTREKVDGTSIPIPLHPSKVMVVTLNLDDKWRRESLKRKTPPEIMKPQTLITEEKIDDKKKTEKVIAGRLAIDVPSGDESPPILAAECQFCETRSSIVSQGVSRG